MASSFPPLDEPEPGTRTLALVRAQPLLRKKPDLRWSDPAGDHTIALSGRHVVGSATRADLVIADPAVSRLHAELEVCDEGVWVRDLGSRNGSFVNGVRVTGALAHEGCKLRFGSTELFFDYGSLPLPVELWPKDCFGPLEGASTPMRELFAQLAKIAPLDSAVLVTGETGTGKELAARAIHEASPRAEGPFVVVDCAALPENLIESELFGHSRGAFTGAVQAHIGAFEVAKGGTVFLDEIGELSLAMQPKLLRVLESRTIRRLGETIQRKTDVRVIAATHRDLRTMVNAGAFREDLYFRLAVLPVCIPPLRARPQDIPFLIDRMFPGGSVAVTSPDLVNELMSRPWLGNVRELRSFVERAIAFGATEALALGLRDSQPFIELAARASVPIPVSSATPPLRAADLAPAARDAELESSFELSLREFRERWREIGDREYVERLLGRHGRSVSAAAVAAGVDRTYLYRWLRDHRR